MKTDLLFIYLFILKTDLLNSAMAGHIVAVK